MVQSNKILTVSYGTFSCTLEGFDDAFGTMKAIAEYFRDLAAEDRYFGAEPPQPDAEMLAHIAQKEISRRVEAHRDETGYVLRAEGAAQAEDGADEVASQEDTAAFFAQSQAVVEESDAQAPEVVAEPVAPVKNAGITAAADSIAAKLQRIRAVVSRSEAEDVPQDFSEDEHAEAITSAAPAPSVASNISDILAQTQLDDVAEDEVLEDDDMDELNARLDALDPAEDEAEQEMVEVDAVLPEPEPEPEPEIVAEDEADVADPLADFLNASDRRIADEEQDSLSAFLEDTRPDAPYAPLLKDIVAEESVLEDDALEDDALDEAQPLQARVVKVTKEQFDALLAADRGEHLPVVDLSEDGAESTTLTAEEDADLMRELAAIEAEMADDDAEIDAYDDEADADALEEDEIGSIFADTDDEDEDEDDFVPERAILSDDADQDPAVARLLEEADDKLSDSETSNRRSEFAHLRAAMAAGKAEEAAGGTMSEAASDGVYREDLARVVRPRRPEASATSERSRRPDEDKPAPLKLVAAQRVDADIAPVQPRRVMSSPADEVMEDGAEGQMKFADYCDSVGATELPDLLEAAAAYLSFVEGQEQFSRPQLMTKVRMVEKEEFSREDGLRSFGLLLRDGKIEKTQAGRFTVSDRIGFRPEDMRAAG